MQMTGQRHLAATRQQAWQCLNDPEVLRACLPGCDRFERHIGVSSGSADGSGNGVADGGGSDDGPRYDVGMRVKVGPVAARFTGRVTLSQLVPPESYRLAFEGQGGAAGFGRGTSAVRLTEGSGGGCELGYDVTASVGGKLAQIGQRLIDATARAMADDFFRRFESELLARHPAPATTPAAEAAAVAGEAAHATPVRTPARTPARAAEPPRPQAATWPAAPRIALAVVALALALAIAAWAFLRGSP